MPEHKSFLIRDLLSDVIEEDHNSGKHFTPYFLFKKKIY